MYAVFRLREKDAMTIRSKFSLFLVAIVALSTLLISSIFFFLYKKSVENLIVDKLASFTEYRGAELDTYFDHLLSGMQLVESLYVVKKYFPKISDSSQKDTPAYRFAFKRLNDQLSIVSEALSLRTVLITDSVGNIVFSSNSDYGSPQFPALPLTVIKKAFETGKTGAFYIDNIGDDSSGNGPSLMLCAPANDENGRFLGVMLFDIDLHDLLSIDSAVTAFGSSGEILLAKKIGSNIEYVFLPKFIDPSTKKLVLSAGQTVGIPMQEALNGGHGVGRRIDYRGVNTIASWRYIPAIDWGLVAKTDEKDAFASVAKVRNQIIILFFLIIIISYLVTFFWSHSIIVSLQQLLRAVTHFGSGNYENVLTINRRDEIGILADAFNSLSDRLKKNTVSIDVLSRENAIRKSVEKELIRSNEDLEQFAYVASHDLQEPLRMMSSYSSLLDRRYKNKLDADADEFIGYIVDGSVRMQSLINALLVYSRIGRGHPPFIDVSLSEVLFAASENLKTIIDENNVRITHDALPVVRGIADDLIRVFSNLLSNAIKFRGVQPPAIHISAVRKGAHWLMGFKDNGIGMEMQYAERIFVIFQRLHTRDTYPGTGIGLAICKKIVEASGGRIWVESEPGRGATFYWTVLAQGGDHHDR